MGRHVGPTVLPATAADCRHNQPVAVELSLAASFTKLHISVARVLAVAGVRMHVQNRKEQEQWLPRTSDMASCTGSSTQ